MADKQMEKLELHTDSVKAAAESMGINNLSDDAASLLAEDATYRIKQVLVYVRFSRDLDTQKHRRTLNHSLTLKRTVNNKLVLNTITSQKHVS